MDATASSVANLHALDASPGRRGPVGDARGRIAGWGARVLPAALLALSFHFVGLIGAPKAEGAAGSAAEAWRSISSALAGSPFMACARARLLKTEG